MSTAELTKKIELLPEDSYAKVEALVDKLLSINNQTQRDKAFEIFMRKMGEVEKSVQERGYYSEEEVEKELSKV